MYKDFPEYDNYFYASWFYRVKDSGLEFNDKNKDIESLTNKSIISKFLDSFKFCFFRKSGKYQGYDILYEFSFSIGLGDENIKYVKLTDCMVFNDNIFMIKHLNDNGFKKSFKEIEFKDFVKERMEYFGQEWIKGLPCDVVKKKEIKLYIDEVIKDFTEMCDFANKEDMTDFSNTSVNKYIVSFNFVLNDFFGEIERQKSFFQKEKFSNILDDYGKRKSIKI